MELAVVQGAGSLSREDISTEVRAICASVLLMEPGDVRESSSLFGELQAESIDILDILTRLEEGFGVVIDRPFPFLDRAFFEEGGGNFEGGVLSSLGAEALSACTFLSHDRLLGEGGAAYLASIAPLVDLAHREGSGG